MPADPARARYLADAVATATPARRIVLLYDRLWLDIQRAQAAQDCGDPSARDHLQHAQQILAELLGSLDVSAWSGAADLAVAVLLPAARADRRGDRAAAGPAGGGHQDRLHLRESWQQAEAQLQGGAPPAASSPGREAVRVG